MTTSTIILYVKLQHVVIDFLPRLLYNIDEELEGYCKQAGSIQGNLFQRPSQLLIRYLAAGKLDFMKQTKEKIENPERLYIQGGLGYGPMQ